MKKSNFIFIVAVLMLSTLAHGKSCEEMVGQMIITDPPPPPHKNIGGVIVFKSTLKYYKADNQTQIHDLMQQFGKNQGGIPRFVSFDQEGGVVQRLNKDRGFKPIDSPKTIGNSGDYSRAGYWGGIAGKQLSGVGGNMNFSTVADLCMDGNPVINDLDRCYSSDPEEVANYARENLLGNMYYDVLPTLKHFPGHGSTTNDTHLDYATIDKTEKQVRNEDMLPYSRILSTITELDKAQQLEWNKAHDQANKPLVDRYPAVMVGHLTYPRIAGLEDIPASLNRKVVTDWLRNGLGHKGLIVTDDIGVMKAIRNKYSVLEAAKMAIKAGNDQLIIKNEGKPKTFTTADDQARFLKQICADKDPLLQSEIADSYVRILQNKKDFNVISAKQVSAELDFIPQTDLEQSVAELRGSLSPAVENSDSVEI